MHFTLMHCCKSFSIYLSLFYLLLMKIFSFIQITLGSKGIYQGLTEHLFFYFITTYLRHIESYKNNVINSNSLTIQLTNYIVNTYEALYKLLPKFTLAFTLSNNPAANFEIYHSYCPANVQIVNSLCIDTLYLYPIYVSLSDIYYYFACF